MGSFLRIDGAESDLSVGRLLWYPATGDGADGVAIHLSASSRQHLLHLACWLPGLQPSDLSGAELTATDSGPEAALDGRLFRSLLVRFGRIDGRRAVLSLDGEVEGMEAGSRARSLIAADIVCPVIAADIPSFCNRCGRSLAGESVAHDVHLSGKRVTTRRPPPTCPACAAGEALAPPQRCSTCGIEYEPDGVEFAQDERTLAYTCTCPHGHMVSGTSTLAA